MQNRSLTYRSSGLWIVIASSILVAFFVIDALVRGFWGVAGVTLLWGAAIIGTLAITLVMPRLHTGDTAVTLVSPMRTARIPWSQLSAVVSNRLLTLETVDGRRFTLFDAPGQKAKSRAEASHDLATELRMLQQEHGSAAPSVSSEGNPDAGVAAVSVRSHTALITTLIVVWAAAVVATIII